MGSKENEYSDEILTAYLDRELRVETSLKIADAAKSDASLSKRLEGLDCFSDADRKAFDSLLDICPVEAPRRNESWIRSSLVCVGIVASVALTFLVTSAFWFHISYKENTGDWLRTVASYHDLYSARTVAGISFSSEQTQAQLKTVGSLLQVGLDGYATLPGLTLVRAQSLQFEGEVIAHLTYKTDKGEPVALCITMLPIDPSENFTWTKYKALNSLKWSDGGYSFVLIGKFPPTEQMQLVEYFEKSLI